jgi:hypothetical protein
MLDITTPGYGRLTTVVAAEHTHVPADFTCLTRDRPVLAERARPVAGQAGRPPDALNL